MPLPHLALRLTATAAALFLLLAGILAIAAPASAAATYTFYVSGSSVGQTAPGVAKDYTLNLTNLNSSASISFNLSIVAGPIGWTTQLSQASLTVGPSGTGQVVLTVRPPLSALADAVGQFVNVTATPDDNTTAQTASTTTRVTEVLGVSVTLIPQAGTSGDPGQNITWLAYVQNTGNSQQTYTVNVNNTSYTSTNLTTNLISVSPGDTRVILVTINISTIAPVGTLFSQISATSSANSSVTGFQLFAATVNPKRAVGLSGLTPDDLHASTESEAAVTVRNIIVENRGNVADSYTLQGTANASRHGDWVSFQSTSLSLGAFTQRYLNVTVTVPASITATGDYTVEFRIFSENSTAVIAFLNLTITVTAKHDLSIVYESLIDKQSGDPGATVSFPVNVSNPGAFDDRVDLTYAGPNGAWVTISATPFTLTPGAWRIVYYNFSIPGTAAPSSYAFQVAGTINWTNPYRNRTVDLTLEVRQVYDVLASSSVAAGAGLPGATVVFTVNVRNNGTGQDNFTVSASNTTQAGLVTVGSSTVSLAGGASANVTVSVAIALSPAPAAGVYYYAVTARSSGNVSRASTVNLALTVNQTFALSATVVPSYQSGDPGTTLAFTVSVVNNGNGPDTVSIQQQGAGPNLTWVTIPLSSGTISAGGRMNFTVQVTAPSWTAAGAYPLGVRVVSGGDLNVTVSPSFTAALNTHRKVAVVAAPSNTPNAHRNTSYSVDITVRNSGNLADTFTLELAGTEAAWTSLPFSSVSLNPDENLTFTLNVAVPPLPTNGPHVFWVNATSLSNSSVTASRSFNITVNDVFRPELTLPTRSFAALPYATVSISYTVRNNGTLPDTLQLTVTTPLSMNQTVLRNFTLSAGAAGSFTVPITMSYPYDGPYQITFRLISLTDSAFEDNEFANITLYVVRAVTLSASPLSREGGPTDTLNYTLTVENTGNISDTYDMGATAPPAGPGNPGNWGISFSDTNFTLAPGASRNVTVTITAPSTLATGTWSTFVGATSLATSAVRATLSLSLVVTYLHTLTNASSGPSLLPGATATVTVLLTNDGSSSDQYTLVPNGTAAAWSTVFPPVVTLGAHSSVTVTVDLTVPSDQHEGVRTLILEARSTSTSVARTIQVSVTVLKVYGFSLVAPSVPILVSPGQTAAFNFSVVNTGNTNDTYTFVATPGQYATFSPSVATADAQRVANVSLLYAPPSGATAGSVLIQLTVFGGGSNVATVNLTATVRQVYNLTARGLPSDTFQGAGAPGTEVQLSFNITNRGNGPDTFTWVLDGEAAAWAQQPSGQVFLAAGLTTEVAVFVDVPSDPLVAIAGSRSLNATVRSVGGGTSVSARVLGAVVVDEMSAFGASFDLSGSVTATVIDVDRADPDQLDFTIFLRNLGNRPETIQVSRAPISGWVINLLVGGQPGSSILLQPGANATAVVRIASFPSGAADDTVSVTVRTADNLAPPVSLSITVHFLAPDVKVVAGSVQVSDLNPASGSTVSVTFTVTNTGRGTATGVQVQLLIDGQERADQDTLQRMEPNRTVQVTLTWTVGDQHAGKSHTVSAGIPGGSSATADGSVDVPALQRGLVYKITSDTDLQMMMVIGLVIGLVAGLAARGRRKAAPAPLPAARPAAPAAPPSQGPEAALAGLAALEAEGQGARGGPGAAAPPQPPQPEHKIVCPSCGTEQWIRGAEGECKTCGVIIEISEEEEPGPAPEGA